VGKTILAVTYAEKHRHDYRATWWIRAETEDRMRADLGPVDIAPRRGARDADLSPHHARDGAGTIINQPTLSPQLPADGGYLQRSCPSRSPEASLFVHSARFFNAKEVR